METASGPIYELTYSVDREIVDAFDSWLAAHIGEALHSPGISAAEIYQQEDDDQGRARRIAHYYFFSDTDLEQYLADQDDAGSDPAIESFAANLQTTGRILRHAAIAGAGSGPLPVCLNCTTPLSGQYCGHCGQRATSRLISVWELLRDAFGDLLELDSRLWRTLVPLTARPGRLTLDYLEGRRARYMPPFRMYLVLSIVFFLVAFFDPREEMGILFEPVTQSTVQIPQDAADNPDSGELIVSISSDGDSDENCDVEDLDRDEWPAWLSSRLTQERVLAACDAVIADNGRVFGRKLLDNVPTALFVLLPLMALVLKVLYPLSKRYYVEHLLFVVHYHAFVFLLLSLQVLFARLGSLVRLPETVVDITTLAVLLYVPAYLYKALRRVYGQGRPFTILKFLILIFGYFAGLLMLLMLVGLFAAFSI